MAALILKGILANRVLRKYEINHSLLDWAEAD